MEHRYKFIVSGSLLGVELRKTSSIPIGSISTKRMFPMDIEEFLWANGIQRDLIDDLKDMIANTEEIPDGLHKRMMDLFKDYLICGGLPYCVDIFLQTRDIVKLRNVQKEIYELDGRKLRDMPVEEKEELVRSVRNSIQDQTEEGCHFVDEHYCFPTYYGGRVLQDGYNDEKLPYTLGFDEERNQYEIVFQPGWITNYNVAIYMDIDPEIILGRFRTSEGCKCNTDVILDDIYCWKNFEIGQIQDLCHKADIPLFYVYGPEKSGKELAGILSFYNKRYVKNNKNTQEDN